MTAARQLVITHTLALVLGAGVGACAGQTLRVSGFGVEIEVSPPIAAKLEGLTAEERATILERGMFQTPCPQPADKPEGEE